MRFAVALGWGMTAAGCGDFRDCSEVVVRAGHLPDRLSDAGLYDDLLDDRVVDGAIAFTPRFPLWTDGAEKRRWLVLPSDAEVDTRAADRWRFPVGTRAFKEFVREGVVVETRLLQRDEDGWIGVSYRWEEDGTEAYAVPQGAADALGTPHDIPAGAECLACHGGRGSVLLGFAAIQLPPDDRAALYDAGVLSDPVPGDPAVGDVALAGLGVLHANCSHCHNPDRDDQPQATPCYRPDTSFDFTLPVAAGALGATPAAQTGARVLGAPARSKVLDRMGVRNRTNGAPSMPPLGTEVVDPDGMAAVEALLEVMQ
jgi:hypothetical protein